MKNTKNSPSGTVVSSKVFKTLSADEQAKLTDKEFNAYLDGLEAHKKANSRNSKGIIATISKQLMETTKTGQFKTRRELWQGLRVCLGGKHTMETMLQTLNAQLGTGSPNSGKSRIETNPKHDLSALGYKLEFEDSGKKVRAVADLSFKLKP